MERVHTPTLSTDRELVTTIVCTVLCMAVGCLLGWFYGPKWMGWQHVPKTTPEAVNRTAAVMTAAGCQHVVAQADAKAGVWQLTCTLEK